MNTARIGLLIHHTLVASAGILCLAGFLSMATTSVQADGSGCQTGSYCTSGGTGGTCNYDVDKNWCCCQLSGSCPQHNNCNAPQ
jgi:hypothetical protein